MKIWHTQSSRTTNSPRQRKRSLGLELRVIRSASYPRPQSARPGFTIVELLIVVVVIAILAAITIVAYNGITAQAKESSLKSDLTTAAKKLNLAKVDDGSFPGATPDFIPGSLTYSGGGDAFCITGSANGKDFQIKETGVLEQGNCALPMATTMQTFTQAHCSSLDTFTGGNNSAVVQLTDSRGGITRTYDVAKLADGKCWMLTNLKLGSTSGSITLTPADSNVASNFTLPQLTTSGAQEYDLPRAYGPVPGDTGSGATNYGYLYNFSAATSGETRASLTTGNAQHSICPANWRLPTGDSVSSDFGQLDVALGGTGSYAGSGEPNITKWQYDADFKGVLSGARWNSFGDQGYSGGFWSTSTTPYPNSAANALLTSSSVAPGDFWDSRSYGLAVRCRLN